MSRLAASECGDEDRLCRVLLIDLGTCRNELAEPLGIETIAAHIEARNPGVTCVWVEVDGLANVLTRCRRDEFEILGISTKITAFKALKEILSLVDSRRNRPLVVLGDVLATFGFRQALNAFPQVICVRGEGEHTMSTIVLRWRQYGSAIHDHLIDIPNLCYICDGNVRQTERQVPNLGQFIHPRRVFLDEIVSRGGIALLEASRGCSYSACRFCSVSEKYGGGGWRAIELDAIISQLRLLSQAGVRSPYFSDEDFFGDSMHRVHQFCTAILAEKTAGSIDAGMGFYLNSRVQSIIDAPSWLLALMKASGVWEIALGIESGAASQAMRYGKSSSPGDALAAVNRLQQIGIDIDVGFIMFDPDTTVHELRENMRFIRDAGLARNSSRLGKRLRMQPGAQFCACVPASLVSGNLDLDSLEYPYEFVNADVGEIYRRFHAFERHDLKVVYAMQSLARGEVPDEGVRHDLRELIACYRQLHLDYLDGLVRLFERGRVTGDQLDAFTGSYEMLRRRVAGHVAEGLEYVSRQGAPRSNTRLDVQEWAKRVLSCYADLLSYVSPYKGKK